MKRKKSSTMDAIARNQIVKKDTVNAFYKVINRLSFAISKIILL